MSIYIVQVFLKPSGSEDVRQRAWGYYNDRASACDAILKNVTDMFECGYYDYGVVVELPEGLMQYCTPRNCFKYEVIDGKAVITEVTNTEWIENAFQFYPFGMESYDSQRRMMEEQC